MRDMRMVNLCVGVGCANMNKPKGLKVKFSYVNKHYRRFCRMERKLSRISNSDYLQFHVSVSGSDPKQLLKDGRRNTLRAANIFSIRLKKRQFSIYVNLNKNFY